MRPTDTSDAYGSGPRGPAGPGTAGPWLRACQRLSLALAARPRLRRVWAITSRPLRQYWAGRVRGELWAPLRGGLAVPVRLWEHVEAGIFWYGFPAEDMAALEALAAVLPRDAVVLDIGANVGAFTLPGAARADQGAVHGFEPASATAARLRRNVEINGLGNVIVNRCAVSDHAGRTVIWIPGTHWKGRLHNTGRTSRYVGRDHQDWHSETVDCVRLDDYVARLGLERVDALKIDVEGGELDVLEGARALIRRFQPLVVMEVNRAPLEAAGRTVADVLRFWQEHDYRVGTIPASGRIRWERAPDAGDDHQNLYCTPSPDRATSR